MGETAQQAEALEQVQELVAAQGTVLAFEQHVNRPAPPLLVVLTGPSGVGKDVTLARMKELGVPFHYVVTVTTRAQRPGEIDGTHYTFLSRQEYERMRADGELLEHAEVYGNFYGIPRSQVVDYLKSGTDVIMKPDVQGARKIKELEPDAIFIFLAPPSMDELGLRLYYRKTEDLKELATRLKLAGQEMQALGDFDYVVVNHHKRLDETVEAIKAIIQAEKCRVHPRKIRLLEEN
ncbi:MAG: guanylate kinase [Chloroflexota bacterium]|nr:guanylate kinase [Chloroflexota bacterium]